MHASSRPVPPALLLALTVALVGATPLAGQRWTLPDSAQRGVDRVFDFVGRDDPGCAAGVVQDGSMVYGRGYGLANLDWEVPISTHTVFDIGSVSKQFTATAMALLEMDGVLSLDDEVRTWIPELPDYGHSLTLRHLLNHTSGVRDYLTLLDLAGFDFDNVFDEQDGVELITRQQALNFEPGSEYLYSNSGYLLLANVVRRASGRSLRSFLEARVFDPLGMAHTSIWDDNTEILAGRATGYDRGGRAWKIDHAWNFQMGGDGQVITSVDDLMKWDANFYDPVVGGPGLVERLHRRGVLNDGDTISYALGLVVDRYRGVRRVQHSGSWAGFRAGFARFPDQRTSVIVLCNRGDASPSRYVRAVADIVLADAFSEPAPAPGGAVQAPAREPVDVEPSQLARWVGVYRQDDRPEYLAFVVRDGALVLDAGDGYRLFALSPSVFSIPGTDAVFQFAGTRREARLTLPGASYTRVEARDPDPAAVRRLTGDYASAELGVTFRIGTDGPALTLLRPGHEPVPLRPGASGEFVAPGSTLTFIEDGNGRVTGFQVYAGRVTGIVFRRTTAPPPPGPPSPPRPGRR